MLSDSGSANGGYGIVFQMAVAMAPPVPNQVG
jgi:hypothetical protein